MTALGHSTACADLARDCEWSQTDLGPRDRWPTVVEAAVSLLLESPVAMGYCHGERFAFVYNDAMSEIIGDKHPRAWAQPLAETFPEVWETPRVGGVFDHVYRTGEAFFEDGTLLALDRRADADVADEAHFVRGYSPVRDRHGTVLGVLVVGVETTEGFSRVRTVAELASALTSAASVDDVVKVAMRHALDEVDVEAVTVCLPERRAGGWRTTSRRRSDVISADEERLPLIWSGARAGEDPAVVEVAESGEGARTERSTVVLPLATAGVSGAVEYRLSAASPSALQVAVLTSCTRLVTEALGRARLYDAERRTADLLQRTLLPQLLPHRPGVSLAVRYQPVTTGTAAGGDFYDVFEVPDGRLAVVIGDVVGRGVAAATVMGQVRAAVRGAALAAPDAETVFASLDQMVSGLEEISPLPLQSSPHRADDPLSLGVDGELFVTMLYGLLDPGSGEMTIASAGHFPPVLMRSPAADAGDHPGAVDFADLVVGPPLGVPGRRPAATRTLAEGDALLAFTDGLLERRDRDLVTGERELLEALREVASQEPRSICQHTIEQMVGSHNLEDDCALLALVRTNAVHHTASVVVPPLASAVRRTRAWVEDQLGTWSVDEQAIWVAVMGVSELVTNVLLHAATDARVTLDLSPDRLLVTVDDTGARGAPIRMSGADVTATRGRGLELVSQIADACGYERNVAGSTVWFEVLVA